MINLPLRTLLKCNETDKHVIRQVRHMALTLGVCLAVSLPGVILGQIQDHLSISFDGIPLDEAISQLSTLSGVNIVFSPDQVGNQIVDQRYSGTAGEILAELLDGTDLKYRQRNAYFLVYKPKGPRKNYIIHGYVEDEENGEMLAGAHVMAWDHGVGTTTNEYGHFSLAVPEPDARIISTYLGFSNDTALVQAGDPSLRISMSRSLTLKEVVITSQRDNRDPNVLNTQHIMPERVLTSSALGGQFDLHQHITKSTGVTTGSDGIGGLNIRGGSNDQNLVLMDGVPVYNPTHAIGIISVFNPNIIREANFYKAGFSARYAGRLSSVLDVRTKDGNRNRWGMTAGISPLSAHLMVEGPIIKDKVSLLVGGRMFVPGGYLHRLSIQEKEADGISGFTRFNFNDINAKLSAQISPRDRLYVGFYRGRDEYRDHTEQRTILSESRLLEEFDKTLNWGNTVGTFRWNHAFGSKVFSNLTLTASRFKLQSLDVYTFTETVFDPRVTIDGFVSREFKSTIEDLGIRWDIDHLIDERHQLRYGLSATRHHFRPKSIAFDDKAQIEDFVFDEQTIDDALFTDLFVKAWEMGVYVEDRFAITEKLTVDAGLHLSIFTDGEWTTAYPQPRLALQYKPTSSVVVEATASQMVQYMHLLTSSGFGLPTDLWVPSTDKVQPQKSTQLGIGARWSITSAIDVGWQLFYKEMDNLIEFKEGASFLLTEGAVEASIVDAANWEAKVALGSGTSYGSEWQLRFAYPKWNLEANYTLSKTDRKFEELNFGEAYPFRFDRRHSLSLSGTYRLSNVFTATAGWTYGSGTPITLAQSRFLHPGPASTFPTVPVLEFGERNGYRLPAYHRLDIGLEAKLVKRKAEHTFTISLYNVYGRKNLLYVTLIPSGTGEDFSSSQFTVLPFIPSVGYSIRL